jgi:hypothetical protein
VTNRLVAIDAAIAVLIAVIVLIVSPGPAVTGIIALVVVVVCAITFAIQRLRHRSNAAAPRRRFSRRP